jgi:hypothetical protein
MNRKQLTILLTLVVLIGAAGWLVRQRNSNSWQSASQSIGQKLLPDLPVNDIAQIIIKSGTNELNLAKRDNLWCVRERHDYPANFSQISELLLKFADLKIAQTEDVGPSQLGRFQLLPSGGGTNTGTQIEFKDADGKSRGSVLLGKQHLNKPAGNSQFGGMGGEGWPDGRYVMAGGTKTVALVSDALENVQPQPAQWLAKEFFSIQKPRRIAVEFPVVTNSWELTRNSETNDWQLADAKADEKLDASKISSVTSPFASPTFSDVLPGDTAPGISGLTNVTTLTVTTFDNFTYTIKIGSQKNGDFPVALTVTADLPAERVAAKDEKLADKTRLDKEFSDRKQQLTEKLAREKQCEKWIYLLPAYTVDSLLKPRGQLLEEPKKETKDAASTGK